MNEQITYIFEINTNKYAGNFERNMCAFATGIIGECEVGDSYVEQDIKDLFEDDVQQVSDEHGCYRPCSADGNTVEIYFYNHPSRQQISLMKERIEEYGSENDLEIIEYRLMKKVVTTELEKIL